jgi:uncharacterized protein (DUF2461 family)
LTNCVLTFDKGGGFWQPDAATLAKLRRDIDRKPQKIKAVLTDPGIRKTFLGGVQNDEKKAVKTFTNLTTNQSNALKRNPKVSDLIPFLPLKGRAGSGVTTIVLQR